MASQEADAPAAAASKETQEHTSTSPLEMSNLEPSTPNTRTEQSQPLQQDSRQDAVAGAEQIQQPEAAPTSSSQPPLPPSPTAPSKPNPLTRSQTEALGPATDDPITVPSTTDRGPTLSITLQLITGARHPYKIDEKYLRNRKVNTETLRSTGTFDPREMSCYQLKELILTDWRHEWEQKPTNPNSIRLIMFGKMMDDKSCLKDYPFKLDDTNIVQMSVKPADLLDDDEGAGKGHPVRGRDGEERGAGCRCVIL